MFYEKSNHDNTKRKFVRWRAAIILTQHDQAFEGKIIEANETTLILLSAKAFKPGSEARLMLEVHDYAGEKTNRSTLDLKGKIINNALIGHISLFRHQIQIQTASYQQQQLLKKLTQR